MLQLDWTTLLFQTANFLVLLLGLSFFVLRPLRKKLHQRREDVDHLHQNALDRQQEADQLKAYWEEKMEDAEHDAEEIRAEARLEAQRRAEEIIEQGRQRLQRLTEEMQDSVSRQRDELLAEQFDAILQAIIDVSGHVVQLVTTRRTHDDLVTNLNALIRRSPEADVNRYRRTMVGRNPLAFVTTPTALTEDQTRALVQSLTSLLDHHVELDVRVDASLIAGLQVRVADTLFDNSLRSRLEEVRNQAGSELVECLRAEPRHG